LTDPAETADDRLLERLRAIAAEVDAPPAIVDEAARLALSTRRIDAELAELLMDSALETAAAHSRAEGDDVRLLTFATDRVSIEVQVEPELDGSVSVRGLVVGAAGEVTIESASATRTVPIEGAGWFTARTLARQIVRFHLIDPDGARLTTSWVTL